MSIGKSTQNSIIKLNSSTELVYNHDEDKVYIVEGHSATTMFTPDNMNRICSWWGSITGNPPMRDHLRKAASSRSDKKRQALRENLKKAREAKRVKFIHKMYSMSIRQDDNS